jgi:glycosyltransferase involved in cell wall biosynthesis
MRVALIAPPFIPVPPEQYGGTELFLAHLAEGLEARGVDVVVYGNGASSVGVEVRSLYEKPYWPLKGEYHESVMDVNHSCWAVREALKHSDIIHMNSALGLPATRLATLPVVYTVHHGKEEGLASYYSGFRDTHFVCISDFQRKQLDLPKCRTIHHGVDLDEYVLPLKEDRKYLAFLGRIAPVKGTHLAIEVAKRSGIPLKIAGEVQPMFQQYFEEKVKPHIDGKFIEFIGTVGLAEKNTLLGAALALLFPIQWHEPFGLVMPEAMACGAPVIALHGGSVPEVVQHGASGFVCDELGQMVNAVKKLPLDPARVRDHVARNFSRERMVDDYLSLYFSIAGKPRLTEAKAAA